MDSRTDVSPSCPGQGVQGNLKEAAVRCKHQTWQICGHRQMEATFPAPSEVPRGSEQADCGQGPQCPGRGRHGSGRRGRGPGAEGT